VSAHNGAVDHRVFIVGGGGKMLKDPLPASGLCPAAEVPMHVLPVAELGWQVTPGTASVITIEYCLDKQALIHGGHTDPAWPTGQKVFDPVQSVVAKDVAVHWSAPES
jgi:hypothetical protein